MLSVRSLFESYPEHPDTIIVKNEFYPRGLTELDIYNYYIKNKSNILKVTKNREIMFFLSPDLNKTIVKRKLNNSFIHLTSQNYDTLITGRTLSIHNTMQQKENFGIIDIDYHDFRVCKVVAMDVYDYLDKQKHFKNLEVKYTGKSSFHIIVYFKSSLDINDIRLNLKTLLEKQFKDKYDISKYKRGSKPHLDLSSNKNKGGFISLYSLSVWGLKCILVPRSNLKSFNQNQTKIK